MKIAVDTNGVDKATKKIQSMGNTIKGATRPDPVADMGKYVEKLGADFDKTSGKIGALGSLAASVGGPWGIAIAAVSSGVVALANKFDWFGEKAAEDAKKRAEEVSKAWKAALDEIVNVDLGRIKAENKELYDAMTVQKKLEDSYKQADRALKDYQKKFKERYNQQKEIQSRNSRTIWGAEDAQKKFDAWLEREKKVYADLGKKYGEAELALKRQLNIVKELQKKTEKTDKNLKVSPAFGSLAYFDEQIQKLNKEYLSTTDPKKRIQLQAEISQIKLSRDIMANGVNSEKLKRIDALQTLDVTPQKSDLRRQVGGNAQESQKVWYDEVTERIQNMTNAYNSLASSIGMVNSVYEQRISKLQSGSVLTRRESEEIEKLTKKQEKLTAVQSALTVVSQGLAATQSVLAVINAVEKATSTSKHWIEAIAAIASTTAAAVSAVASAKSLKTYAEGGVVGGNRRVGDMQTVRVNSGEMILTTNQTKRLFNMIDSGRMSGGSSRVEFDIRGKDLVGVQNNYKRWA